MSDQLTIGVIGQTLRRAYCQAHFSVPGNAPAVILTDDPGAFADWSLPPGVEIAAIDDGIVTSHRKLRSRVRRRVIDWLRGGSIVGARVEQVIRKVRPAPHSGVTAVVGADAPLRSALVSQLQRLHDDSGLLQIVVFDLFDLPSVVDFSARTGVPVVVR